MRFAADDDFEVCVPNISLELLLSGILMFIEIYITFFTCPSL